MPSQLHKDKAIAQRAKLVPFQPIERTPNRPQINSATGMNHHTQSSVYKVIFESDLQISTLRQAARMFRMPETQILDILRTQVRNRMAGGHPPTGGAAVIPMQRRAA